jgi:hypothetical protein
VYERSAKAHVGGLAPSPDLPDFHLTALTLEDRLRKRLQLAEAALSIERKNVPLTLNSFAARRSAIKNKDPTFLARLKSKPDDEESAALESIPSAVASSALADIGQPKSKRAADKEASESEKAEKRKRRAKTGADLKNKGTNKRKQIVLAQEASFPSEPVAVASSSSFTSDAIYASPSHATASLSSSSTSSSSSSSVASALVEVGVYGIFSSRRTAN